MRYLRVNASKDSQGQSSVEETVNLEAMAGYIIIVTIILRILLSSAYTLFNVICYVATTVFYFDLSDSLQAIWPAAGQIVTTILFTLIKLYGYESDLKTYSRFSTTKFTISSVV